MNQAQAGAREECDFLPLAEVKLRTCGKGESLRGEGNVDRAGWRDGQALPGGSDQGRRGDRLASINRARAADDAVADGAEIRAQGKPGFEGDTEVAFKATLGKVAGWTDHVIEAREKSEAVDVRLLSERRETNQKSNAAEQDALHVAFSMSEAGQARGLARFSTGEASRGCVLSPTAASSPR